MKHNTYLCEECLKCQDPELYCKFRSACPIWFLGKKGAKELLSDDAETAEGVQTREVLFLPDNTTVNFVMPDNLIKQIKGVNICNKEMWSSSVVDLPGALSSTPFTAKTAAIRSP
jgi:hypothetical protein